MRLGTLMKSEFAKGEDWSVSISMEVVKLFAGCNLLQHGTVTNE